MAHGPVKLRAEETATRNKSLVHKRAMPLCVTAPRTGRKQARWACSGVDWHFFLSFLVEPWPFTPVCPRPMRELPMNKHA
ncbi:hypothetical protein VTH06DRAFT_5140 [Thermothelomyces fergusii]